MCKDSNDTVAREPYLSTLVLAPLRSARATFNTTAAIARDLIAVGTSPDGAALDLRSVCQPARGGYMSGDS